MDKLLEIDNTFNESMFLTKVNNIFVMLKSCEMTRNLDRARHFLGDEVEKEYDEKIKRLLDEGKINMFDELNVKESSIDSIDIQEDRIVIVVRLISRYMDYLIDANTKKYISGVNDHRIEKTNYLTFEKIINAKGYNLIKKCPTCGASIDLNKDGRCPYCKTIFDAENYDYILTKIETM